MTATYSATTLQRLRNLEKEAQHHKRMYNHHKRRVREKLELIEEIRKREKIPA